MKTTILIFTILFCSCSTDPKSDNIRTIAQLNTDLSIDTNSKDIPQKHSDPIPLTIIPGQGIDNIKLGTSNYEDVLSFKNLKFAVDSGEGIACGVDFSCLNFWKRFNNEENGLLIEYSSECFPEPIFLRLIKGHYGK